MTSAVHWEKIGILNINFIDLGVIFYGDFKNEFRLSKKSVFTGNMPVFNKNGSFKPDF